MYKKTELKKQLREMGITVEGNYIRKSEIKKALQQEFPAEASKKYSSDAKYNYAICIEGVDPLFYQKPFGRQIDDMQNIRQFQQEAKKDTVGAKNKPTLQAVKEWIKQHKPKYFYAKWEKDSSHYKDDSVEIFYKL